MKEYPEVPSFSHSVDPASLSGEPRVVRLSASAPDRAALADFLEIPTVDELSGEVALTRRGTLIRVRGHVNATLTRDCVATLEPLEERLSEAFDVAYTTDAPKADYPEEVQIDLDAPEPLRDGRLDVGEVLFEQLVLSMAPHPRKEDAEALADPGAGATISPFAVLKDLKPS